MTRAASEPRPLAQRHEGVTIVAVTGLVLLVACAALLSARGTGEAGARAIIRFTARLSAPLFCLAFAAAAINRLWPRGPGRWLLRNRRALGLSFALSHTVHLGALVALARLLADPFLWRTSGVGGVVGGGVGYLFLFALVGTSFDGAVRFLGRARWSLLHTSGVYVLWFIFAFTYFGVALGTQAPLAFAYLALLLAALGLRIVARLIRRRPGERASAGVR
jgi:DMSO/TMAO reductase YedYZ heme-binding membrane subunit